jgi:hypothetical protein
VPVAVVATPALRGPPCLLPFVPLAPPQYEAGDSPLHALVSYGYTTDDAVDREVAGGRAAVNARNAVGATALQLATQFAYFHGMAVLVQSGADLDAADMHGAW